MILERYLSRFDPDIEALILGCTHYPILEKQIRARLNPKIDIIDSGKEAAKKFQMYLMRHPEIKDILTLKGKRRYFTTGDTSHFDELGSIFL
jgi:glutamate racemase